MHQIPENDPSQLQHTSEQNKERASFQSVPRAQSEFALIDQVQQSNSRSSSSSSSSSSRRSSVAMSSKAQKHSTADNRNPLQQTDTLQRVLDYVGPGHWRFVAEVNSLWRGLYTRVASREMPLIGSRRKVTYAPQMTLFSAVFASPSRVMLAQPHGLDCTTAKYQRAAGMYADIATLEAAHELGMPYTTGVMEGAARCNELAVVQFLRAQGCSLDHQVFEGAAAGGRIAMCTYLLAEHCAWNQRACAAAGRNGHGSTLRWLREHGCPWDTYGIPLAVAQGGSVDTLVHVQQQGVVFTSRMLPRMLNIAGAYNKLTAAKWLRAQRAEWPWRLHWLGVWPEDTLAWARAEGCTSPTE
jgi:hypothetical protein